MNHDYAHCLDYTENCPKDCFRAELQRDIEENRSEFIGVPLTYAHLRGTDECKLVKDKDVTCKMSLSTDCVSRQAAIDATWFEPIYTDPLNVLTEVRDRLKELPPAQPERKIGRWYDVGSLSCRCSDCGCKSPQEYSFCPNCGAEMMEVENE